MRQITVRGHFASTHRDEREGPHLHGHSFTVEVTELGNDAGVRYDITDDLSAVLAELHRHNLDEMLVGGSQTLDGIASWVMERLLARHPRITKVELSMCDEPDVRVAALREIR